MKHSTLATCSLLLVAPLVLAERPNIGSVVRHDAALDKLLAKDAKIEVLASGFVWYLVQEVLGIFLRPLPYVMGL